MYKICWLGWKHDKPGEGAGERAKRGGGAAQGAASASQRGDPLQPGRRATRDRGGQGPRHPLTAGEPLGASKSFLISPGPICFFNFRISGSGFFRLLRQEFSLVWDGSILLLTLEFEEFDSQYVPVPYRYLFNTVVLYRMLYINCLWIVTNTLQCW